MNPPAGKRNRFLTLPHLLLHSYHHLLLTSQVNQARAYIPSAAVSGDVSSSTLLLPHVLLLNSLTKQPHTVVFLFLKPRDAFWRVCRVLATRQQDELNFDPL